MKEEKLLSIIVPTYNMERYLSRCLDSLLVSSIIEYIEILVVNDGSKDQSSAIAHNYQERYPQSVKVIDKENGGYGSVLNIGLLNASGKYLKICDSDDWFDSEAFRDFVFQLSKLDTDVVYNSYSKEYLNGKSVKMKSPLDEDIVYNTPYLLSNVKLSRLLCLPEITYKTAVLKECGFTLLEKTLYVDLEYITYPIACVQSISFINCNLYRYFIGRVDQSISRKSMEKNIHNLEKVIDALTTFYSKNSLESYKEKLVVKQLAEVNTTMLCTYLLSYRMSRKNIIAVLNDKLLALKENNKDVYDCMRQSKALSNRLLNTYINFPLSVYVLSYLYWAYLYLKSLL